MKNYSPILCILQLMRTAILVREAFKYCLADFVCQRGTPPFAGGVGGICQHDPRKTSPTRAINDVFALIQKRDQKGLKSDPKELKIDLKGL